MLFTQIHVKTNGNSDSKSSKYVSFRGTNSKIEPDEAILSVKQPLENPSIPAAVFLDPANQMMFNMKHPVRSKYTNYIINLKISLSL